MAMLASPDLALSSEAGVARDAASDARAPQSDCLSCRVLGTSACALGAAIVSWEVYREPRRVLSHRIAMGVLAGAFVALGAYRAVM